MTRPRAPVSPTRGPDLGAARSQGARRFLANAPSAPAPFIGLTGSLRYGRARHHLGSHWQHSDHEWYGNRRVRPANGARLSRPSRRRDAVLLCGVAGSGVVESLSVVAIRHRRLSRPLVRRLPRAESLDGIRAVSPRRRRPSLLARAGPANQLRHLGHFLGIARGWTRGGALAQDVGCCRPRARHALPVLSSTLLTDIFAGLGVLSLHLLIFHRSVFARLERMGLFVLIAFAAATHSATLAVLLAVLALAVPVLLLSDLRPLHALLPAGGAIATGAAMLLAANLALSGHLAWTPGGFGIAFGRILQDGIVKRYLDDHCPTARLKLCPYRNELPATADDFLWSDGVFNELGRFRGLDEEMRFIVLHSLQEYPLQQIEAALAASARQLRLVATGHGTHDQIWHTYGIIERYIPGEVPARSEERRVGKECRSRWS